MNTPPDPGAHAPYLRYGLDDAIPAREMVFYALQHFAYFLANTAILPVIVGGYLGLSPMELATLVQRTFILCGLVSILQVLFGHRFPVMEGPSGLWYGVLITLALAAPDLGKPLDVLRTDIEAGFLAAGAVCIVLGVTGLVGKIVRIFTPIVNGTFLVLMSMQLSPAILNGMLGIGPHHQAVDYRNFLVCIGVATLIIWITLRGKGMMQSLAVLIGVGVGWVVSLWFGLAPEIDPGMGQLAIVPEVFAWGAPTFDAGVILTFILCAVVLFSNLVATLIGMGTVTGSALPAKTFNRGAVLNGVSDLLAGVGAVIGFIPYTSGVALIAMTRVASRRPFILGALFMIVIGLIPQVGMFFVTIPPVVGNSVMFVVFSLILGMGIKEFAQASLGMEELYVVGISLLVGVGVMQLPPEALENVPHTLRYLLLNGLIDGVLVAVFLEQLILKKRRAAAKA